MCVRACMSVHLSSLSLVTPTALQVFQSAALFDSLTVKQNVGFML